MESKTALLHIGTAKTGTTSIQQWLAQAEANGGLGSVCYPLWGREQNHQRVAMLYRSHAELPRWMRAAHSADDSHFQKMRREYRDFLFGQLGSAAGAILSAETLGAQFTATNARDLRSDLESLGFRTFRVLLYVRDPADYYLSMTQHWLRRTAEPPFVKDPARFTYEFRECAETWEQAFPGSLIVRKYPTDQQYDVLADVASVLKEEMGLSLPHVPTRLNTTISAEGMQILQDYRQTHWPDNDGFLTPDTAVLARFLEGTAKDVPQTRPSLDRAIAELIRANHSADAEFMLTRYGVDLGLGNVSAKPAESRSRTYRVDEILQSVDQEIVRHLLLRFSRTELGRKAASTG